ncbi:MAG: FG-GAP-like repeat-containing protein [Bacteroidota bacterium]
MKKYQTLILATLICAPFMIDAQAPTVSDVSPAPHIINAPTGTAITIQFENPIDPASISEQSVRVFGKWSGPASGTFSFFENNTRVSFLPSENLFAGEWVNVSLTKNIKSADGENMETGYTWGFWMATKPGVLNQPLTETIELRLPGENYLQTYGAYAGDMNNDGFSDLVAVNESSDDLRILLNDGFGGYPSFEIYDTGDNSTPSPSEGADFNNDGEIDLVVTTAWDNEVRVLTGNGDGSFSNMEIYYTSNGVRGVVCGDFNGDGWDDMLTTNRLDGDISIFTNKGDGTFEQSKMDIPDIDETSCALADANNDGISDIFFASYNSQRLGIMLGDGNGGFEVSSSLIPTIGRPWMIAAGDLNGDGFADVVSVNSNGNNTAVAFGSGNGSLGVPTFYTPADHSFPLAVDLGDIDGDNDLDIVTSNYSSDTYTVFENDGNGLFTPAVTLLAPAASSCAILHDRDNDGDLDITGTDEEADVILLFENIDSIINSSVEFFSKKIQLNIYPNPSTDQLFISHKSVTSKEITYTIYDFAGSLIDSWKKRQATWNENEIWVVPSELKTGLYSIEVKMDGIKVAKRFAVMK